MKQIILMAITALFSSVSLMAQDASATLRAAFDFSALLSASPDSIISYDENDKKSTKSINVFNENNFVTQTDKFVWEEAAGNWKPDGKTVNTLDSKGRPTSAINYSAAGAEESKEEMTYDGDTFIPKTVNSFSKEGSSWKQDVSMNFTKIETSSTGTLLEGTMTTEGMTLNAKVEMTIEGDISYTKMSTDMMGSWMVMSETKSEIIDKGNPKISKNWTKMPMSTDWSYIGMDYAYFSDHKPGGSTANENITAEKTEWRLNGNILEIPAATNIQIYAIVGSLVKDSRTSTIDVSTLSPGVYIVKTDKGSFKIRF